MNRNLEAIEHLSYVNECVLTGATGEAKTELDRLIQRMESNVSLNGTSQKNATSDLRDAQSFLRDADYSKAAFSLSTATRKLWNQEREEQSDNRTTHMKINRKQRAVLFIAAIAILVMLLYPPFSIPRANVNPGYSFIWSPPEVSARGHSVSFVDTELLLTQYLGVVTFAALAFLLFKSDE